MLSEYIDMNNVLPTLSSEVVHRVVEILKFFNTRTCQLVLGAGAMQVLLASFSELLVPFRYINYIYIYYAYIYIEQSPFKLFLQKFLCLPVSLFIGLFLYIYIFH